MSLPPTNNERFQKSKELGHILEYVVCEIPEKYRIVFALLELNGLTVYETSVSLGISKSTVKLRFQCAKSLIKKKMEDLYLPDTIFEFNLIYCEGMVKRVMEKITELEA